MGSGTCLYALCRQIIHPTLCLGYRFHSYCLLFIFPTIRTCTHILTMKETSALMFSISFLFFAVPSYQGKESHALGSARSVRRGHFQRTSVIEATRQRRRRDSRTHICTHIHTNIDMHACVLYKRVSRWYRVPRCGGGRGMFKKNTREREREREKMDGRKEKTGAGEGAPLSVCTHRFSSSNQASPQCLRTSSSSSSPRTTTGCAQ